MPVGKFVVLTLAFLVGLCAADAASALMAYRPERMGPVSRTVDLRADLDGDRVLESVHVEFHCRSGDDCIVIRGEAGELALIGESILEEVRVVDLDTTDFRHELLFSEAGPSDDPASALVAMRSGRPRMLGAIPGGIEAESIAGDGTLATSRRGRILQTWWYPQTYVLAPSDTLVAVERALYPMRTPVVMRVDLPLVRGPEDPRPAFVLRKDEPAVLWASDDREWVLVLAGERTGWFRLRDGFTVEPVGLEGQAVFEGLLIVD